MLHCFHAGSCSVATIQELVNRCSHGVLSSQMEMLNALLQTLLAAFPLTALGSSWWLGLVVCCPAARTLLPQVPITLSCWAFLTSVAEADTSVLTA